MNLQEKNKLERVLRQKAEGEAYIKQQLQYAYYLNDPAKNPCNYEKQLGNKLTLAELQKRLKKLNPNLFSLPNPRNPRKQYLGLQVGTDKIFVTAYDVLADGCVSENSIMSAKTEEVPNLGLVKTKIVGGVAVSHIDRKDIPDSKWDEEKGELIFKNDQNPAFEKVDVVYTEAFRGWRTILAYLVDLRICTPAQCERVFGSSNTPHWQKKMGKGSSVELW